VTRNTPIPRWTLQMCGVADRVDADDNAQQAGRTASVSTRACILTRMQTVTASLAHDLATSAPDWHIISLSVGPFADPLVQLSDAAAIAGPVSAQPLTTFRCIRFAPDGIETLDLPEMLPLFKFVQPLSERRWLVVCPFAFTQPPVVPLPQSREDETARQAAKRAARGSVPNARVYDATGELLNAFWAGHNVQHVQAMSDEFIWFGWGDEGIFSDRVSAAGMGCLDQRGRSLFNFHAWLAGPTPFAPIADPALYAMNDCSALNVDAIPGVPIAYWGRPHTDPLLRIYPDRHVRAWPNMPSGIARAIAVDEQYALIAGDDDLNLVALETLAMTPLVPVDAAGNRLQIEHPVGRGRLLWFMSGTRLYRLDVRAFGVAD
jgi:hypothetical protein